jgi:archaellum biogenesis ATPase FlaH
MKTTSPAKRKVISSGLPVLDNAFRGGGFYEGTLNLFIGDASSRKDLFGFYFLMEGLSRSENVVFFDIQASSDEIYELVSTTKLKGMKGKLYFVNACPEYSKFYINAVPAKIIDHLKHVKDTKRVLINPLTFFIESFGIKDAGDFLIRIREIAMKRKLVVILLLADILKPLEMQSIIDKCDGIIQLKTQRISDDIVRSLHVKKMGVGQKEIMLTYYVANKKISISATNRIV